MTSERTLQLKRSIATLRDPNAGAAQRAVAGAAISAAFVSAEAPPPAAPAPAEDGNARMFGYGVRHETAMPWDGKSARSGTITYVDDERVEQYVGQQQWIAYRQSDLDSPGFVIGDRLRIGRRAGALVIEAVADNRLGANALRSVPPLRSGMTVLRTAGLSDEEIAATLHAVGERYAARPLEENGRTELAFARGARLTLVPCAFAVVPALSELFSEPPAAALRLEAVVEAHPPEAALEVECALVYAAALLSTTGEGLAIDDSGAIYGPDQLYDLGVRERTRAEPFNFAAAAARRAWPALPLWLSQRGGVCDELIVFSARPWRADFAAAFVARTLEALADAGLRTQDPVIPAEGVSYGSDERTAPGTLQRLMSLSYTSVDVDIAFLDVPAADDSLRSALESRTDITVLLGAAPMHAVVFSYGNRSANGESEHFALEMRRADALATAVAAALARRGDCFALDASGSMYGPDELIDLALQRRGKAASWTARTAQAAAELAAHA